VLKEKSLLSPLPGDPLGKPTSIFFLERASLKLDI